MIEPDGREAERFPRRRGSGENGSSVPFDAPSNASFLGTRLMVANQSFVAGDPTHQAILDVEAGEAGLPEPDPGGRRPARHDAARLHRRARLAAAAHGARRARAGHLRHRAARRRALAPRPPDVAGASTRTATCSASRSLVRAKRRLKRGAWRVTVSAVDASGNASAAVRRSARVR